MVKAEEGVMAATVHDLHTALRHRLRPAAAGVVRAADGAVVVVVLCADCAAQVRLPDVAGRVVCRCGSVVLADGDDPDHRRAA
jgi:DNA-directed RNA polymerase subunit RPC12/RpoP